MTKLIYQTVRNLFQDKMIDVDNVKNLTQEKLKFIRILIRDNWTIENIDYLFMK